MSTGENITVSVVYDNYLIDRNLATGWGLGCVVRTPEGVFLFDTGSDSSVLLANIKSMNINPEEINFIVISHAHGDHSGGLCGFISKNRGITVYIPGSFPKPWKDAIKAYGAKLWNISNPTRISGPVYTTGEMGEGIKEQSLVIDTNRGLVIITGCAHPGILNITAKVREIITKKEIYLCMGGFHLSGCSDFELHGIVNSFRKIGVMKVAPSHCSGDRCRRLFAEEYGTDFIESGVGRIIEI
jgi:7,8-dihydropterin-6-yl-methyl-4-(beta-D-ribofuranosyl)aminobenzene 5'-phosphate synthase